MMPQAVKESALEQLVAAAIRAPSGDNTQPWRFILHRASHRIEVHVDEMRDSSPMNAGQCMSRIACGAAIENIFQMARARGWTATLETRAGSPIAMVSLQGLSDEGRSPGRIEDLIARRAMRWRSPSAACRSSPKTRHRQRMRPPGRNRRRLAAGTRRRGERPCSGAALFRRPVH